MGLLSNKIDREQLKPGDHIYSWREAYIYAHHGIYVGDGMVIHFTRGAGQEIGTGTVLDRLLFSSTPSHASDSPCPRCGDQTRTGVIYSCLDCFLSGGNLYLFEYGVKPAFFLAKARGGTCTLASSDPAKDVLHRALFLLEYGFGSYNVFKNNCEDFAIYCKTGLLVITSISVGRSGQAASYLAAAKAAVSTGQSGQAASYLAAAKAAVSTGQSGLAASFLAAAKAVVSIGRSGQAPSYLAAAKAVVSTPLRFMTTSFSGLALVGVDTYCANRLASDIGVRDDAYKVPVEGLIASLGLDEPEKTAEKAKEDLSWLNKSVI